MWKMQVRGLQDVQRALEDEFNALKPDGRLGKTVHFATNQFYKHVKEKAHVVTGTLKAALREEFRGLDGRVFVSNQVINPRTGTQPSDYVVHEELRRGDHALFTNTVVNDEKPIIQMATNRFRGST